MTFLSAITSSVAAGLRPVEGLRGSAVRMRAKQSQFGTGVSSLRWQVSREQSPVAQNKPNFGVPPAVGGPAAPNKANSSDGRVPNLPTVLPSHLPPFLLLRASVVNTRAKQTQFQGPAGRRGTRRAKQSQFRRLDRLCFVPRSVPILLSYADSGLGPRPHRVLPDEQGKEILNHGGHRDHGDRAENAGLKRLGASSRLTRCHRGRIRSFSVSSVISVVNIRAKQTQFGERGRSPYQEPWCGTKPIGAGPS